MLWRPYYRAHPKKESEKKKGKNLGSWADMAWRRPRNIMSYFKNRKRQRMKCRG